MVAIRPPNTAKFAMQRVIDMLPMPVISEIMGQKPKQIYKYSRPEDEREVSVKTSLRLDAACYVEKGVAPFFDLFDFQRAAPNMKVGTLKENILLAQQGLGNLSGAALAALMHHRAGREVLSPRELQEILFAVLQLELEIAKIKTAAIAASKGE